MTTEAEKIERRATIKSSVRFGLLWKKEDYNGLKILAGTLRHEIRHPENHKFACPLCKDLLFGGFAIVVKPKNPPKEGEQPSDHILCLEQRNAEVGDCEIKLADLEALVNSRGENWFVGNLSPEIEIRITPYGGKNEEPEEDGLPDYSIRMYRKLSAGD